MNNDYAAAAEEMLPALIRVESGGNPSAVSPKGARGSTQVMDATARDPGFGVQPMRDQSDGEYRRFARDYLAAMLHRYRGDRMRALAAYNAGPRAVDKAGGVPRIRETQDYVGKVLGLMGIGSAEASEAPYQPPADSEWEDVEYHAPASADDEWEDVQYTAPVAAAAPEPGAEAAVPADLSPSSVLGAITDAPYNLLARGVNAVRPGTMDYHHTGRDVMDTAIRSTVKGLGSVPAFAIDVANAVPNLGARAINAVRPGTVGYLPMGKDYMDAILRHAGIDPEAASWQERAATGALAAGTGVGANTLMTEAEMVPGLAREFGAWSAAAPVQQAAGSATASMAGDAAHELGAPAAVELAARVAGGMAPGAGMLGAKAVKGVGTGKGRAVRELDKSLRNKFGLSAEELAKAKAELQDRLGVTPAEADKLMESGMAGGMGVPEFVNAEPPGSSVPGFKWTTAMLNPDKGPILELEKAARTRHGDLFYDLNLGNQVAASSSLRNAAWPQERINAEKEALNARTQPLQDVALMFADQHPRAPGVFTSGLNALIDRIRTSPGERVSEGGIQELADMAERYMNPKNRAKVPVEGVEVPTAAGQGVGRVINRDVDTESDDVLTAIRKLGGLDRSEWGDMDILRAFKPDPRGPVFGAAGNPRSRGLDDMTSRLIEHGYLPPEAKPRDLEELLTDIAAGVADPSRVWSSSKSDYGNLLRGARSLDEQNAQQLSELISLMKSREERANTPRPPREKEGPEIPDTLPPKAADLARLDRDLGDFLRLKPSANVNDMPGKALNNRRTTVEIRHAAENGLDEASGGRYGDYKRAYAKGMEPIESGASLKELLERFDAANPLPGTDLPSLTPHAFRRGVEAATYKNLGKSGHADKLTPKDRKLVKDIADMLNATERAMTGARGTVGSNTAADITAMLKQGAGMLGGDKVRMGLHLLDMLGLSSGARQLDLALTDPKKFQELLDAYHAGKGDQSVASILKRTGSRLPLVINAVRQ